MKKLLLAAVAVIGLSFGQANAEPMVATVDTSDLSNSAFMVVVNHSMFPIVHIQTQNISIMASSPGGWVNIPSGMIQPNAAALIRFGIGGWGNNCMKNVFVQNMAGKVHMFQNVNVCSSVRFDVPNIPLW